MTIPQMIADFIIALPLGLGKCYLVVKVGEGFVAAYDLITKK